jgi:hypothetical protein
LMVGSTADVARPLNLGREPVHCRGATLADARLV